MALEIERRFLVKHTDFLKGQSGRRMVQGYIAVDGTRVVRVRVLEGEAFLCIKGLKAKFSRLEFEYRIPVADAEEILAVFCEKRIEKVRYDLTCEGMHWEVDVFEGANAGLTVAEVELEDESQPISLPEWAGREISEDPKYFNFSLAINPFSTWVENG